MVCFGYTRNTGPNNHRGRWWWWLGHEEEVTVTSNDGVKREIRRCDSRETFLVHVLFFWWLLSGSGGCHNDVVRVVEFGGGV